MMPSSNSSSLKSGVVPDMFPAGLRVLVVDDDPTCLMILKQMLTKCNYEATVCKKAVVGLSLLRENKNAYDVVLSDVHMPDMDGFKLLEHIGLEMDLPVIMMSADDGHSLVMKGVTHGACDYLIKPIRIEELRNIWQHVVRRRRHEWKDIEPLDDVDQHEKVSEDFDQQQKVSEDVDQNQKVSEDVDQSSSANEGYNWKKSKRLNDEEEEDEELDEPSSKKARVVWTVEKHQQFVAAVNMIGIDKAVPKRILELMSIPDLSRENVASHLQKYRQYLKRLNNEIQQLRSSNTPFMGSESQQLRSINTPFMGSPDSGYGSMSSLNGLNLQGMVNGQLTGQSLSTLHAAMLGSSSNSNSQISMSANQRNVFSFEDSNSRFGEVNSSQLLHGIPTNMGPKQFAGLRQSQQQQLFSNVNSQELVPMGGQSQSQSQNHSRQPILSDGMLTHGLGQSQNQSRQPILSDETLTHGLGMKVSGGNIDPSYNIFNNNSNLITPQDSGFEDMIFNNELSYSSQNKFPNSFLVDDESGTHINGSGDNQDELLAAILNQQQQGSFRQPENEFIYGGLDDLSHVT